MNWTDYNKIWGMLVGGGVGFLLMWLALKVPAIVQCTVPTDHETCTVLGTVGYDQIYGWVLLALAAIGTRQAPKNTIGGKPSIADPKA